MSSRWGFRAVGALIATRQPRNAAGWILLVFGAMGAVQVPAALYADHRFQQHQGAQAFPELTEREREVLELVAQGHNDARMARHFVLSQKTIRNHVANLITKLQVAVGARASVRAREAGMGQLSAKP